MAIVLARRDEIKTRPLEIILTGNSLCTACLFSPGIVIKNTLLRSVVIAEILQKATISMSWLLGLQNLAALLSKLFFNAIEKINSDLYRKGPISFTNPNEIHGITFLKISMKDGDHWLNLPSDLIMKERRKNTISLKDTKAGETFGNVKDIKD